MQAAISRRAYYRKQESGRCVLSAAIHMINRFKYGVYSERPQLLKHLQDLKKSAAYNKALRLWALNSESEISRALPYGFESGNSTNVVKVLDEEADSP